MNNSKSIKTQSIKNWRILTLCLVALVVFAVGISLFLPESGHRRDVRRLQCMNNIRNLGIANHNYASQNHGALPISYSLDAQGNRLLSWRYSLLDLLDNAALKRLIDPEKPWDSETNRDYSETQITVFICPTDSEIPENGSSYFTITGDETLFPEGPSVTLDQISEADGMTNTLMLTEAADMDISWLEPRDIPFSAVNKSPQDMKGIGPSSHHEGFNIFYTDGHAKLTSKDIDPKVLRALITWNGGEKVPEEF
ncbi:DUF1559 family PulG-like putative transporter [Rubinisphaera italica]|uniref:DUF1559 domain-containing protein n=1 Tax=Rubinisphaera italica TaxID=2527969 RepID=A0A5C5XAK1_9PLAN|nr:DUF1559 domain-containing protein [Rubinisphaera italica]TWT60187.1 hypothetical protein Pan54_09010 [Rubinisphaera italica]